MVALRSLRPFAQVIMAQDAIEVEGRERAGIGLHGGYLGQLTRDVYRTNTRSVASRLALWQIDRDGNFGRVVERKQLHGGLMVNRPLTRPVKSLRGANRLFQPSCISLLPFRPRASRVRCGCWRSRTEKRAWSRLLTSFWGVVQRSPMLLIFVRIKRHRRAAFDRSPKLTRTRGARWPHTRSSRTVIICPRGSAR